MEIQRNIASRLAKETAMDHSVEVLTIAQSLIPDAQGRVKIEDILIEAQYKNMTEQDVMDTLDKLNRNGTVKVKEGFVFLF